MSKVTMGGLNSLALHLVVEDLGLASGGRGDKVPVKDLEDILADPGELRLDPLPGLISLRLLFLLDGGDDPPRNATSTDNDQVRDGEQVALLNAELLVRGGHVLHILNHEWRQIGTLTDASGGPN
jgi:hypothetical protein